MRGSATQTAEVISLVTQPAVRKFLRLVIDNAGPISAAKKTAASQYDHYVDLMVAAFNYPIYDRELDEISKGLWRKQAADKTFERQVYNEIRKLGGGNDDKFWDLHDYYLARLNFFTLINKHILELVASHPINDIKESLETGLLAYAHCSNFIEDIYLRESWARLHARNLSSAQRAINSIIRKEIIFNANIPDIGYYKDMFGADDDLNDIAMQLGLDFERAKDALTQEAQRSRNHVTGRPQPASDARERSTEASMAQVEPPQFAPAPEMSAETARAAQEIFGTVALTRKIRKFPLEALKNAELLSIADHLASTRRSKMANGEELTDAEHEAGKRGANFAKQARRLGTRVLSSDP